MAAGCVWGIDIGKSALKAVRMREGKEEVEILTVCHLEYEAEEDGSISPAEASAALDELIRRYPVMKKERVLVALPGQASFSRFIKLPAFDPGRVDEIVGFEAQQQIPFPVDEVVWDYDLVEDDEASDDDQEVGLFAIKKELVYAFLGDLKLSGLEPDVVTSAPLAAYNFVRFDVDYDDQKAVVVLDIGWDHTDLLVVDGDRYWIRNLALSGQELTKAIAAKLKQTFANAEDLKREAQEADDQKARKVYQATQLVLKDFVSEIHRSIGYYKAQNKGRKVSIGEILLLGNGSKLPNVRPYFQRELGYPVKVIRRISELTLDDELGSEEVDLLKEQLPSLAVAFGLGIQGAGFGFNEVNLLPQEMQLEKSLRKKRIPVAIAVALLFVAVILSYLHASSALEETRGVLRRAGKHLETFRKAEGQIARLKNVAALEDQTRALASLVSGRNDALGVLNAVAAALPANGGALVEATPEERRLLLNGRKRAAIERVEAAVRGRMEDLNAKKVWLLTLDLEAARFVVGKVGAGARVTTVEGRGIAVDPSTGIFRHKVDAAAGKQVKLLVATEGAPAPKMFTAHAGGRVTLEVAKLLQGDEKDTVEAIARDVLAKLQARLPGAALGDVYKKIYALEAGATAPGGGGNRGGFGSGATQFQTFLKQTIVVDYPPNRELLEAEDRSK